MEKSLFEQHGGSYTKVGNYLIPNLTIDESEQQPIGKYGRMRKRYLKDNRPIMYSNLLSSGKLHQHLADIDQACMDRIELIAQQMKVQEGVVEYDPASGNTSILFVKKWKEKPSCIWEIRDNRDKTVSFLSNADIEKGLKTSRQKKVVVGRTGMKDSHWILERV